MKTLKNFYVIEGLDGAGTTTLSVNLKNAITSYIRTMIPGWDKIWRDKEPEDSDIGKVIRKALSGKLETPCGDENNGLLSNSHAVADSTMAFLFAADRDNHINNPECGVKTRCKDSIVLCDRYMYSSFAYQTVNDNLEFGLSDILTLNSFFPDPEVIIYVDTPVETCMKRIESRNGKKEIYEKADYLESVAKGYNAVFGILEAIKKNILFIRVDGTKTPEEICEEVLDKLKPVLNNYMDSIRKV